MQQNATGERGDAASGQQPLAGARTALVLLLLINMFNYIDRQVLAAVEPQVRRDLLQSQEPEDRYTRTKMGLLSTAFLVSYILTAPMFGLLAERRRRWPLIAVAVVLWSVSSGASGLAATYGMLLLTRCFVGVGEGAYGPIAPMIISDLYPVSVRGRMLSWFYMAIPVGGALGYALGGPIAALDPQAQSWRWAFYLVVIPGLLLGAFAFLMREPLRGAADRPTSSRRAEWKEYRVLLRTPSYVLNTLGMAAMTFALGAFAWWMPDYLQKYRGPVTVDFSGMRVELPSDLPECGVSAVFGLINPTLFFGALTAVAGLVATLSGGMAGDALRKRFPGSYFLVSGAGLLLCAPCCLAFLCVPFPLAWVFVFLAEFFLFFNTGPTNAIIANVTHPSMRATAFAVNIFVIHLLGDASSPWIVGAIADHYGSLIPGFVTVSAFMVLGGILWLWGARYLERDTAAAPRLLA